MLIDALFINLAIGFGVLLLFAMFALFIGNKRKLVAISNFVGTLMSSVFIIYLAINVLQTGSISMHMGGEQLGLPILIDSLSAVFLILISLMASVVAFYCIGYMDFAHYAKYSVRGFYFAYPMFILGMLAVVVVDDLSNGFTIAWQIMTISSYWLIRYESDNRQIIKSANKYLIIMQVAWLLVVIGALLIPSAGVGADVEKLANSVSYAGEARKVLIFSLILIGFFIKAGMFPFGQIWLPGAHSSAPSPISALLSGVMIKTGVYGIIRTFFWIMPTTSGDSLTYSFGFILASLGVVSLFIGTVQALKQHDAKRLHAYHSIGQMGYILLALGLAQYFIYSDNADLKALAVLMLIGSMLHLLNHAVFKSMLFLATGSVQLVTGTKDIDNLGGLYKFLPWTALGAGVASAAISGIPAFSGFVSKWAIISASVLAGHNNVLIALFGIIALMTSAITLASYVKFFGMSFTASGVQWTVTNKRGGIKENNLTVVLPQLFLVVVCLIQGLFPVLTITLLFNVFANSQSLVLLNLFSDSSAQNLLFSNINGVGFGGVNSSAIVMPLMLVGLMAVTIIIVMLFRAAGGSKTRSAPVWLGSYQMLNNKNRSQASHIYASFKHFMRWTGGEAVESTKETIKK